MEKKNYTIVSNCDGLKLDVLEYVPDQTIKGIVQIAHGMSEHKERYEEFMEYLANRGYVVCIHDHRGHGKSVKSKEDYGYFYDETGTYIVEDVLQINHYLKNKYQNVPFTLLGHSMGSLVVRVFLKKYDSEIDQLIVCGSPSANSATWVALLLVDRLSALKGNHHRSSFINNMAFSSYTKNIQDKDKNEYSWLSINKENVSKYIENELDGFVFTLNGFKNLFLLMQETYSQDGWKKSNLNIPILFIAGSEDPCITNEKKWLEAQAFLKNLGYTNIQNHLYQGYRHEILKDDCKEEVFKDVEVFLS